MARKVLLGHVTAIGLLLDGQCYGDMDYYRRGMIMLWFMVLLESIDIVPKPWGRNQEDKIVIGTIV